MLQLIQTSILSGLLLVSNIALSQNFWNLPFNIVNNPGYVPPEGSFNAVYDVTHSFTDLRVLMRVPTDHSQWNLDNLNTVVEQFRAMESVGGPQVFGIGKIPSGTIDSNAPFGVLIEKINGYKEYKVPDDFLTARPQGLTDAEYQALQKYSADLNAKGLVHDDMQGFFVEENQFGGGKTTRFRPIDPDFLNDNKNTFGSSFLNRRPGQTPTWKPGNSENAPTSPRRAPGGEFCPSTPPRMPPYVAAKTASSMARAAAQRMANAGKFVGGNMVKGAMPTTGGGSRMTGGIGALGLIAMGMQAGDAYNNFQDSQNADISLEMKMAIHDIVMKIAREEWAATWANLSRDAAINAFGNTFGIPMLDVVNQAYERDAVVRGQTIPSRAQFISGSR